MITEIFSAVCTKIGQRAAPESGSFFGTDFNKTDNLSFMASTASTQNIGITAQKEDQGQRADLFLTRALSAALPDQSISRVRIASLIKTGHVRRHNQPFDNPSAKIKEGDIFVITIPPSEPTSIEPSAIDLDIFYEDDDLIVINKPAGLPVHPSAGHHNDTLVNALLHHCGDNLSGVGGQERPGIVHRLDMDTSGLIVAAKTDLAHHGLAKQFAARNQEGENDKISREYLALVWGWPPPGPERIDAPIGRHPIHRRKMAVRQHGGKPAITKFRLRERFGNPNNEIASLLACHLLTGRTHQIRVHLTSRDWPIIGDPLYQKRKNKSHAPNPALRQIKRQALHAAHLGFIHPRNKKPMRFDSPLPADIQAIISALRAETAMLNS